MNEVKRKESEVNGTTDAENETETPNKSKKIRTETEESVLGKYLLEADFKSKFSQAYKNSESFKEQEAIIYDKPFKCCILPNFISDEEFLKELKQDLLKLNFKQKSNDLYKFKQSDDLKTSSSSHISSLRSLLYKDFRTWIQEVCELELTDQVDMSCAKYEYTDVLLCHDDELEGRMVAYILYLVPPDWQPTDGGSLDLYKVDEHVQADSIAETLVPQWNSLAFFEVSPVSFHQVAEVLCQDKTRLSISGWFHGNPVARPTLYKEPCQPTAAPTSMEDERLLQWVNPLYLDEGVVAEIRDRFEDESEIELQDFLLETKYTEVLKALRSGDTKWTYRGPANKRHYERVNQESFPVVLRQLMELLRSAPMFKLLRTLTGLDLAETPLTSEEKDAQGGEASTMPAPGNPRCRGEVRRWSHGSYTLVHDTDPEKAEYALDAMLFCGCEVWKSEECGGFTSYLASGEDEELLSVQPLANALALVYRDMETVKFVKHINHKSVSSTSAAASTSNASQDFYDLHLVYYE